MQDDDRDLVNRLFAVTTAMLEDAAETAAAGQDALRSPAQFAIHGRQLQAAVRDAAIVAETITIVANLGPKSRRNARKIPG